MTTQTERSRRAGRGLVHVDHLTKHYRKTPALRDYSLSLDAGHIVGLMGPNGCGKTTLLKILAGVLNDYQGQVGTNLELIQNPSCPTCLQQHSLTANGPWSMRLISTRVSLLILNRKEREPWLISFNSPRGDHSVR